MGGVRRFLPDRTGHNLIFVSQVGTPVEPRNFGRVFHQIREKAGLRWIRFHDTRHTAAYRHEERWAESQRRSTHSRPRPHHHDPADLPTRRSRRSTPSDDAARTGA
ncbi:hypothetical protein G5V59_13050 [Nocardioides sp. W3-2-3]|nr:hypothetical protein [Nocardioides convexus]